MKTETLYILGGIVLILLSSGCIKTGEGETTDTIHSIEYSGLMCKTWKVWLTHDMPTENNEGVYSIHPSKEESVIDTLKEAHEQGKQVHFKYHTEVATWGCWDELHSGYAIIDSVEVLE